MGVRLPSVAIEFAAGGAIPQNGETTQLITPPINITLDSAQILIFWQIGGNPGTGQTAWDITIRRGTGVTGFRVNRSCTTTVAAGTHSNFAGCVADAPGAVAGQQYCIGINATGGSASGQLDDANLIVMVL